MHTYALLSGKAHFLWGTHCRITTKTAEDGCGGTQEADNLLLLMVRSLNWSSWMVSSSRTQKPEQGSSKSKPAISCVCCYGSALTSTVKGTQVSLEAGPGLER